MAKPIAFASEGRLDGQSEGRICFIDYVYFICIVLVVWGTFPSDQQRLVGHLVFGFGYLRLLVPHAYVLFCGGIPDGFLPQH